MTTTGMNTTKAEKKRAENKRNYERHKHRMATDPAYRKEHRRRNRERVYKSWAKKSSLILERKGTRCSRCDGTFTSEQIHLHHIDPKTKEFSLANGNRKSLKALMEELEKVVPLCEGCHCRLHHPPTEDSSESHCERPHYASKPEAGIVAPRQSGQQRIELGRKLV
jgi:5-methylcytosine-specific restriction endonuclease McrA